MSQAYQDAFTAIEECPQPVIAAIHGACYGGAVDLVSACDVRYAAQDAFFSIKVRCGRAAYAMPCGLTPLTPLGFGALV